MKIEKKYFIVAAGAILLAMLDQLSKSAALAYLKTPLQLAPFFSLRYEENTGIAWSIPVPPMILLPFSILLILFIPYFIVKNLDTKKAVTLLSLALIIGGGLGNIYDRILRGFVIDFISVGFWPVFNLADTFLSIGIFIILLFYAKIKRV